MAPTDSKLRAWMHQDLKHERLDLCLLCLAFASAIVDTMSVPVIGVFVSNSTGNLLFLSLAAAGLEGQYPEIVRPAHAAIALASSWVSAFCAGVCSRRFGVLTRWFVVAQFAFEGLLILIAAVLIYAGATPLSTDLDMITVALLGWAFGSQSVLTKAMKIGPIMSPQVVTGTMVDLFSMSDLLVPPWQIRAGLQRNRRAAFLIVFFVGGVCGGLVLKHVNAATVLLLCAAIKLVGVSAFLIIPSKAPLRPPLVNADATEQPKIDVA